MERRSSWTFASLFVVGLGLTSTVAAVPPVQDPPTLPTPAERTVSFWASPDTGREPVDVAFRDMDLVDALRFLTGEETNVIQMGGAGAKTITMDLRGVQPGQALDYMLQYLNLGAEIDGNTVMLSDRATRTLRVPIVFQEESKIWEEIETGVQNLSTSEGQVALNKSGGIMTLSDEPAVLDRLERHIDEVITSVLQQIEIQVEILEATYDIDRGAGIDWFLFNGILDPEWGVSGSANGGRVGFSAPTDPRGTFQLGLVKANKWQTVVDAFENDVSVDVVSRPRVTVMSNQPAEFALREKIPYLQKTVSQEGGVTRTDFEIVFDEAGVSLTLLASVTEGGEIQLDVAPVISSVTGFTPTLPDLGTQPIIDTRETKSVVRLAEGQALVMSGMLQDRESSNQSGVPFLKDIPFLGRAFRHEETSHEKTEVIIIVTPKFRQEPAVRSLAQHDRLVPTRVFIGNRSPVDELASARGERAWTQLQGGDESAAIGLARSAYRARPSSWWTLNNLGLAQREMGLLGEAEKTLRSAVLATEPSSPVALVNYGTLVMHRGRPAEAVPYLRDAAAQAPRGRLRREANLALALALELSGRLTESLEVLDRAVDDGAEEERALPRKERLLEALEQASLR